MPPWRNWLARSAVNRKVGGSSPPGGAIFSPSEIIFGGKNLTLAGLEPAIPWFVVRCLIRWATGPPLIKNSWFCRCLLHDCYKMAANIETGGLVLKSSRSTFLLSCSYSRDSSVGRALDWRSKGPRFDPGSRHSFSWNNFAIFFKNLKSWLY